MNKSENDDIVKEGDSNQPWNDVVEFLQVQLPQTWKRIKNVLFVFQAFLCCCFFKIFSICLFKHMSLCLCDVVIDLTPYINGDLS